MGVEPDNHLMGHVVPVTWYQSRGEQWGTERSRGYLVLIITRELVESCREMSCK